jgi:3-methyladenine DNA glycosylase AlkD
MLEADREPMVVKALSWALRELAKREPAAVRAFLAEREGRLAARVVREVRSKLDTGLKSPRR